MNHLFINRDYPPCPYPHGGIGTYVKRIAPLLVERGDTVHVITQLWPGAPRRRETSMDGRLIVHRVPLDEPLPLEAADSAPLRGLRDSEYPLQTFAWQAARLTESLIADEAIEIIEAQEYEAPLYFLLLRRALGLSGAHGVPAIVHLHTGTEFAFVHNGYQHRPDFAPAVRLEDYAIRHADAVMCPSRFLAGIAAERYGIERSAIAVIPYPVGVRPELTRDARVWADGTISYVGRLEPRKGLTEWIDAAVAVAHEQPGLRFTIIGNDAPYEGGHPSTRDAVRARIPRDLKPRFVFIDFLSPDDIAAHLAAARLAVVPSRFDNFPNTCIEAMSSGLPVLATPSGGAAEMIDDGRTGWIADGLDARSLEAAFRRALATPPHALAAMGSAAASAIRTLCDNARMIDRHREFKQDVVRRHADRARTATVVPRPARGIAAVVNSNELPRVSRDAQGLLAVICVDDGWTLAPDAVARIEEAFERLPDAGAITPWYQEGDDVITPLPLEPASPRGDVGPFVAFRIRALADLDLASVNLLAGDAVERLVNAVVDAGWSVTPYPHPLARRDGTSGRRRDHSAAFRIGGTLTPGDILHAPPDEWRRLIRRAWTNPGYVAHWLTWHGWRALRRVAGGSS